MSSYPILRCLTQRRFITGCIGSLLAIGTVFAQPTTNPVTDSTIDLGAYDASWVATMVDWNHVTTTAAVANDGNDDLATIQAEITTLSASGGGVLYFPAGTYNLSGTLYLANGVVLRGATPATNNAIGSYTTSGGGVRTYDPVYNPTTDFQFPLYVHNKADDLSYTGTLRSQYFKSIEAQNPSTDSNFGIVNIDINGAYISINDRSQGDFNTKETWGNPIPKNWVTNKNILIFGNRINNAAVLEPGIPQRDNVASGSLVVGQKYFIANFGEGADFTSVGAANNTRGIVFTATDTTPTWGTGSQLWTYQNNTPGVNRQNLWQIWPTRTRGKIDVVSAGNTLIGNNSVLDLHYRHYALNQPQNIIDFAVPLNTTINPPAKVDQYLASGGALINSNNSEAVRFSDGNGIRLNHILDYTTAHTAVQEPSKHREGQGIINNFVFATSRVGLMGAGNGLVVHNNVRVDFLPSQTKYEIISEQGTYKITGNATTMENRGIDVTSGHGVVVAGNYIQVKRGTFDSGYPTVDGEGLLLQESSSTSHPTNWLIKDNTLHSYIGIYRVMYSNGVTFDNNIVYGGDQIYTDGSRNASMGRTGGTYAVIFKNNTAGAVFSKYNIKPRNYVMIDQGGNFPAPENIEEGNGGTLPGVQVVDAVPELEILYPRKSDLAGLSTNDVVTMRVKVIRHPDDVTNVAGVKVWDGITNYPANGQMGNGYWTFDGLTAGQPAGIALTLVEPEGSLGGGVYEGTWTVPAEFDLRGMLVAEIRLHPQATTLANGSGPLSPWTERNWAFVTEGSGVEPTLPVGVIIEVPGSGAEMSFASIDGLTYQLEVSSDLTSWAPVGSPLAGTGSVLTLSDDTTPSVGNPLYYRVAVSN